MINETKKYIHSSDSKPLTSNKLKLIISLAAVVKAMDFHPAIPGLNPTNTSHWWHQESHSANTAPSSKKLGPSKPSNRRVLNVLSHFYLIFSFPKTLSIHSYLH